MKRTCCLCDRPIPADHAAVTVPEGLVDVGCAGIYWWRSGRSLVELRRVAIASAAAVDRLVDRVLVESHKKIAFPLTGDLGARYPCTPPFER